MKIKTVIILIAVSLIAGAVAGFLWAANAFKKLEIAQEVEVAAQAGMNAITLAQLRLNEATNSIHSLENQIYVSMQAMATWDQVMLPDKITRERRDQWLTPVKIYYQSYPPHGQDAPQILSFLAKIPEHSTNRNRQGALCRLDDLRRAGGPAATNAVTK
jgi:hypothetical protein